MAKILIVDDDQNALHRWATHFTGHGHRVEVSSELGLAVWCLESLQPDVVIADIVMPRLDGLELIAILRRDHPNIKIVALSGGGLHLSRSIALRMAKSLGVAKIVSKPLSENTLHDAAMEALQCSAPPEQLSPLHPSTPEGPPPLPSSSAQR